MRGKVKSDSDDCLEVSIDLGKGHTDTIKVFPGSNIENLVNTFCLKHSLMPRVREKLIKQIEENFHNSFAESLSPKHSAEVRVKAPNSPTDETCVVPAEAPRNERRMVANQSKSGHVDKHKAYEDGKQGEVSVRGSAKCEGSAKGEENKRSELGQIRISRPIEVDVLKNGKSEVQTRTAQIVHRKLLLM